jgi:hypothetical protein
MGAGSSKEAAVRAVPARQPRAWASACARDPRASSRVAIPWLFSAIRKKYGAVGVLF